MEKQESTQQIQGWKDVNIVSEMPLSALVNFFNVLNQRLCEVENNVFIKTNDNRMISLTQSYAEQAQAELAVQQAQAEEAQKEE